LTDYNYTEAEEESDRTLETQIEMDRNVFPKHTVKHENCV